MRLPILVLAIVLTIASICVTAWSQVTAPEDPKTPWREVVVAVTDQPDEHYHQAREEFLKGNRKDAAMEVGKAAEFFRLDASSVAGKEKGSLLTSFRELEKSCPIPLQGLNELRPHFFQLEIAQCTWFFP